MHFETYDELAKLPDCKYVVDVDSALTTLTGRVESLNMAGDLLWPEPMPDSFSRFPISSYQWLDVATDVFLLRYISVLDCCLILTAEVHDLGLALRDATIKNITKRVPDDVSAILRAMLLSQGELRDERNARMHHGRERGFTQDPLAFHLAAMAEHRGRIMVGDDIQGRQSDWRRSFNEGLVELQREFNARTKQLERELGDLYSALHSTFEENFSRRYAERHAGS